MLKQLLLLLISFCIFSVPRPGHAETKVLTAEGICTMGDSETISQRVAELSKPAKKRLEMPHKERRRCCNNKT
jgi:hypothetical protein